MVTDEEIDLTLVANVTNTWRKIAFVIGTTMTKIDHKNRVGLDDSYFLERLVFLVEKGLIEHKGDLTQMRECEVRLGRTR